MKTIDIWQDRHEDHVEAVKDPINHLPNQNPYGLLSMVLGGVAFVFGPNYGIIPPLTLLFSIITVFTFDKEHEDNSWPFYIGMMLSLIGLVMFILGETHLVVL